MRIGILNLVQYGLLEAGVATVLFGFIPFIPQTSTLLFTVAGFGIRTLQGIGIAATLSSVYTILADTFPEDSTLVLVRPNRNIITA